MKQIKRLRVGESYRFSSPFCLTILREWLANLPGAFTSELMYDGKVLVTRIA